MQTQFVQGKPRGEPYRMRGVNIPCALDEKIENYRFQNRHTSFTSALIELAKTGLEQQPQQPQVQR